MQIHVKPALVGGKHLVVRDPADREPLPPEGKEVERDSYWLRRIADGDVVGTNIPAKPAKKAKE